MQLLWEMPDEGAFLASVRARTPLPKQAAERPTLDPDSPDGRLLARRGQRGWTTDRYLRAAQLRAAGADWPLPGESATPAARGAVVVSDLSDLDAVLT